MTTAKPTGIIDLPSPFAPAAEWRDAVQRLETLADRSPDDKYVAQMLQEARDGLAAAA